KARARWRSASMATTSPRPCSCATAWHKGRVRTPGPGPISKMRSPGLTAAVARMSCTTRWSCRKCWPRRAPIGSRHAMMQSCDADQFANHAVAGCHRSDSVGGACEDDVARLQRRPRCGVGDELCHAMDHVARGPLLLHLVTKGQTQ